VFRFLKIQDITPVDIIPPYMMHPTGSPPKKAGLIASDMIPLPTDKRKILRYREKEC